MESDYDINYAMIIDRLKNTCQQICDDYKFNLSLSVNPSMYLNAGVSYDKTKTESYHIEFYAGCFNLNYQIEEITKGYDEIDLDFFPHYKDFCIFEINDNDSYREIFNKLFSSTILIHILFHECGHIIANHIDEYNHRYIEYNNQGNCNGSYESQEKEMVADWYSTTYAVFYYLNLISYNWDNTISDLEISNIIKEIMLLFLVSLSIEFQIFDNLHYKDVTDNSKRTHPHPSVRLFYNREATLDAVYGILVGWGMEKTTAKKITDNLIGIVKYAFVGFLSEMDAPLTKDTFAINTIDYYIKLRDVSSHSNNINYLHLSSLADDYRDKAINMLK